MQPEQLRESLRGVLEALGMTKACAATPLLSHNRLCECLRTVSCLVVPGNKRVSSWELRAWRVSAKRETV